MQLTETKQQFDSIIGALPEGKFKSVIDFTSYLKFGDEDRELFEMQTSLEAYQEWLSPDHDIYKELFQDELPRN
ncbi:MAG: hypothetical protein HYZ33_01745 [Ignavibacteriales bacterium]|nr:hypothetical protein [Ignavibacteriales bacterium]